MSKRARITLELDPEPAGSESVGVAVPKTAVAGTATAESAADEKNQGGPKTRTKAKPGPKSRTQPKAATEPGREPSRGPEKAARPEPQQGRAADPAAKTVADAGRRPYVNVAPQVQAGSGFRSDPAEATKPSKPPPGVLNLGAVLKVAAVGLVVVSVVLWLKRKP